MAQIKGQTGNPYGRPKGVANKATIQAREAIAMFVEGNAQRLTEWLDQIAADNPKDAFDSFMKVVEYHIPKLARSEIANPAGEAFRTSQELNEADKKILQRFLNSQQKELK